jgi:hypothetical protein
MEINRRIEQHDHSHHTSDSFDALRQEHDSLRHSSSSDSLASSYSDTKTLSGSETHDSADREKNNENPRQPGIFDRLRALWRRRPAEDKQQMPRHGEAQEQSNDAGTGGNSDQSPLMQGLISILEQTDRNVVNTDGILGGNGNNGGGFSFGGFGGSGRGNGGEAGHNGGEAGHSGGEAGHNHNEAGRRNGGSGRRNGDSGRRNGDTGRRNGDSGHNHTESSNKHGIPAWMKHYSDAKKSGMNNHSNEAREAFFKTKEGGEYKKVNDALNKSYEQLNDSHKRLNEAETNKNNAESNYQKKKEEISAKVDERATKLKEEHNIQLDEDAKESHINEELKNSPEGKQYQAAKDKLAEAEKDYKEKQQSHEANDQEFRGVYWKLESEGYNFRSQRMTDLTHEMLKGDNLQSGSTTHYNEVNALEFQGSPGSPGLRFN